MNATKRYRTPEAAKILSELMGIELTERKLVNWRYARRGPEVEYFNSPPSYTDAGLRRFAREAFRPQPPVRYRVARRATATA